MMSILSRTVAAVAGALVSVCMAHGALASEDNELKDVTYLIVTTNIEPTAIPYGLLGQHKGWFEEEGLNVTLQTVATGGQAIQLLLADQAQVAFTGPETLILAGQTGGRSVKMFHPLVRKQIYQAIVREDSPVTSYCDLLGKTVGVAAFAKALDAYINTRAVQDCGQPGDTVRRVETGFGVTSAQALESGSIDAFVSFPTLFVSYEHAGYKFRSLAPVPWRSDYYGVGYTATTDYMEKNPDAIEKFSRVLAKSAVYTRANPEAAIKAFWKEYPQRAPKSDAEAPTRLQRDLDILNETMDMMRINEFAPKFAWGSQGVETWKRHIDLLKETDQLPAGAIDDPAAFFTNEFNAAANNFDRQAVIAAASAD